MHARQRVEFHLEIIIGAERDRALIRQIPEDRRCTEQQ